MWAQFRTNYDFWAANPVFADLLARLREGCPEIDGWWEQHRIAQPRSGRKTLHHPTLGMLAFHHKGFQANDDPALKLVIYMPVGSGDETPNQDTCAAQRQTGRQARA